MQVMQAAYVVYIFVYYYNELYVAFYRDKSVNKEDVDDVYVMNSDVLKNFSDLDPDFGKVDEIVDSSKIGEFKLNEESGKSLKQVTLGCSSNQLGEKSGTTLEPNS